MRSRLLGPGPAEAGTPRCPKPPPRCERNRVGRAYVSPNRAESVAMSSAAAEVDDWIARPPARQEPLNRRMEHDLLQLAETEQPVPPHRRISGRDRLERAPAQIAREDDVDDVLGREAPLRGDRIDDRHRPLDRDVLLETHLLDELPMERVYEALARVHASAGQQPVRVPMLLVPTEEDAVLAAQDGRDTDARLDRHGLDV
jgi:hypothetical protein